MKNNKLNTQLEKTRQDLLLCKKQISIESEKERKRQTREKIELGGLITKAGLQALPKAELLGLLIEAKRCLDGNDAGRIREKWQAIGHESFSNGTPRRKP